MIGNWEYYNLDDGPKLWDFSQAYLLAALRTCNTMVTHEATRTWANANVAMFLAAHSVELFFKAAIAQANTPFEQIHAIDRLRETYAQLYPEPELAFDPPFRTEYFGLSDEQIREAKKRQQPPSIVYRYPMSGAGEQWFDVAGFDPSNFLITLDSMHGAMYRIWTQITGD